MAGRLLVTGAAGFLGGRIVEALLERGLPVRAMHRPGRQGSLAADPARGLELASGQLEDLASLRAAVRGCRAVFHAAARVTRGGARSDFERVNVDGLRAVLDAAREEGVERVIVTSSFFALGPSAASGPGQDESALSGAYSSLDKYGSSKRAAALVALRAAREGAPVVLLLPGALVGPGPLTEANFVSALLRDHLCGRLPGLPGGGRRRWPLVHVDDVARAHADALDRAATGEAYVLGGENATLAEVFGLVARWTGVAPPRRTIPHAALWAVGAAEELLEAVTGRPPRMATRGVARVLRHDWALDSSKAWRALDYRPRPLEDVVRETVAWLHAEGLVPRGLARTAAS